MQPLKIRFSVFFLMIVLAGGMNVNVLAQGAVRIVNSTAAGGTLDQLMRGLSITSSMKSALGNYIVTDNRSGSNGMVAVEFARSLPGDGSAVLAVLVTESGGNAAASAPVLAALAEFVPIAYLGSVTSQTGIKSWYGLYGPPGMSGDMASRLSAVVQNAMQSAEITALTGRLNGWSQDRPAGASTLAQLTGSVLGSGTASAATARPSVARFPNGSNEPSICDAPDGYDNARPVKPSSDHNPANSAMHCVCLTRDRPVNGAPMYKFVNRCSFAVNRYFFYRPGSYTSGDVHARGGSNDYAYQSAKEQFTYYFCKIGKMNAAGDLRNGQIGCL